MSYRPLASDPGADPPAPSLWRNVTLPATAEYADWLRGLADHLGLTVAGVLATAIRKLAGIEGYADPPHRLPQLPKRPGPPPGGSEATP